MMQHVLSDMIDQVHGARTGRATKPVLLALAYLLLVCATWGEESQWWEASEDANTLLAGIVQEPQGWTIVSHGKEDSLPLVQASWQGEPVVRPPSDLRVMLASLNAYPGNSEIVARFRLLPPPAGTARVQFAAGLNDPLAVKEKGVNIHLWANRETTGKAAIGWKCPHPNTKAHTRGLTAPGFSFERLDITEDFRKRVERDKADIVPIESRWCTLRIVLSEAESRVYFNGRLMARYQDAVIHTPGRVRLSFEHVELATLRVYPKSTYDPRFEPIDISSRVNTKRINGHGLATNSLPNSKTPVTVAGIPFQFPSANRQGHDHIDIGRSWFRVGSLEGRYPSYPRWGMDGRWPNPLVEDPSRICFRVPNSRYRALHLIAAADDDADSTPVVTVQFYRARDGHPASFSGRVPAFSAKGTAKALPVKTAGEKPGRLYLVTIPITPGDLAGFADLDVVDIELTKGVKAYKAYPDPMYYSTHAAGLPSSVHVYAMTFERPQITMTITPESKSHVWTAPANPRYEVQLHNKGHKTRKVLVRMEATAWGAAKPHFETKPIRVAPGKPTTLSFTWSPTRHGHHDVVFILKDGEWTWKERVSSAWLHPDTRTKGDWQPGRGPLFGFYNWSGAHHTPSSATQMRMMAPAGFESIIGSLSFGQSEETLQAARENHYFTRMAFASKDIRIAGQLAKDLDKMPKGEAVAKYISTLEKMRGQESDVARLDYLTFFPEPVIGEISYGIPPLYRGLPAYKMSPTEEKRYQRFHDAFVLGARAAKARWPGLKTLMPHGDVLFPMPFLRRSEEFRELFDGIVVDNPLFERLPEQQLHQGGISRCYMMHEELKRAGKQDVMLIMNEGSHIPTAPGSLENDEIADLWVRDALMFIAYGVAEQNSAATAIEAGDYWGEQHYGGGVFNRVPLVTPKPVYSAVATMTRHLNRKNFKGWLATGSGSTYALEFAHHETNELTHVFWNIRGERPVTADAAPGAKVLRYDQMDNPSGLQVLNGKVTFTISSSPCFVVGLAAGTSINLGPPDHGDQLPSADSVVLANVGDGSWQQDKTRDEAYEESMALWVRRIPGVMSSSVAEAPKQQGGRALAIKMDKQSEDCRTMPFYTTIRPAKAVPIPGKASHLGLWVRANSDWGRVIYSLRDAQGERWISVGSKEQWNCDDISGWSAFNFDGWRYLRFPLPAHSPYDLFIENGAVWWGHYGPGDGVVDLPLSVEKVIVERRTHTIYVNDIQPANTADVLLGDLIAEYADPIDKTAEAIRLSKIRMPIPKNVGELSNKIAELTKSGMLPPTEITGIRLPDQHADGRRCFVNFREPADAKSYEVWVSPYPDGRGALRLGRNWRASGRIITGLRPEMDFYLFAVYANDQGQHSKPSPAYKIRLKDMFGFK